MGLKSTLVPFTTPQPSTPDARQLSSALERTFEPLLAKEILDGRLIRDVLLLSAGVTHVEHKLGRPLLGYIVVKNNTNSLIWDGEFANDNKNLFLDLYCSANVIVSLWVF